MIRTLIVLALMITSATTALADGRSVTLFSDGAAVEIETTAHKGITEIALPSHMIEGSLRITPLRGATILRVELLPNRREEKTVKELDGLREQKYRMEDRLQALATREEIFKSAARSQSAKAPRKTKSNPDPMLSIRQGTDFAIAQLESVYTARRKTEQEIRRIDSRLAALQQGATGAATIARVTLATANGKVKARYALAGPGWTPRYDLHLNGDGDARLTLYGKLPDTLEGARIQASPGKMTDDLSPVAVPAKTSLARLADYRLISAGETFGDSPTSSFSCILTNPGPSHLTAGEASLYRNGEYRGEVRFQGISSGRSRKIAAGPRP